MAFAHRLPEESQAESEKGWAAKCSAAAAAAITRADELQEKMSQLYCGTWWVETFQDWLLTILVIA
jgi:hypothetical protein